MVLAGDQLFTVPGPRSSVHDPGWPSASIEADAARLLHLPRPVLRVGAAVGDLRQRGRESAALLPVARGAPLRHGAAHGRDDARRGIGQDADGRSADDLPGVSGSGCMVRRAGSGAYGQRCGPTGAEDAGARCTCGLRGAGIDADTLVCWARTSSSEVQLNTALKILLWPRSPITLLDV